MRSKCAKAWAKGAGIVLLLVLGTVPAFGQANTGAMVGTVHDGSGAVMPGVTITIRNGGAIAGDETVQLYIGDPVASRSRPVRELKAFRKVTLQPGETQAVSFLIAAADVRFFIADRLAAPDHVFEPGKFVVQAGPNSQSLATAEIEWPASP